MTSSPDCSLSLPSVVSTPNTDCGTRRGAADQIEVVAETESGIISMALPQFALDLFEDVQS